ncbi:MAG TPA: Rid family detoxifying hydrolase [Cyclobacteriaceae bacterium]|nr:Rid family detoxifying hydrolase [Cyclobacteriaceae bacterium]HRK53501.1 Rid family detoxifying hydrolase [Cyclobacteriaceae bacterium]
MNKFPLLLLTTLLFLSCQPPQSTEVTYSTSEKFKTMNLPFSEAVIVGNTIYLSGQIGNIPGQLSVVEGGIKNEAKQAMENIKTVLENNGSSMENVIKCTVMLADINEWASFNEEYVKYFPGDKPARSAFATNGLALNARVEIECIAIIKK